MSKRGVHGEKLVAALRSEKLPEGDKPRLNSAINEYDKWIEDLESVSAPTVAELIEKMVARLNEYKRYVDLNLIFDSHDDFLYRQKGQLKLDNTVVEEFLPILVSRCLTKEYGENDLIIGSQTKVYSTAYFVTDLSSANTGGGFSIKTKDQDFSICRELYLMSSFDEEFKEAKTISISMYLGYTLAEIKTNLDKTMFQEASATAHDVKMAVTGAKYYLLCDYLDMTPLSSATTDIDEILVLRKAKRIGSNTRKNYSTYKGRQRGREQYIRYLDEHPYCSDVFQRFVNHIFDQYGNRELEEKEILNLGYF